MKYCLLFLIYFFISIHITIASNPSLKTRHTNPSVNMPRLSDNGTLVEIPVKLTKLFTRPYYSPQGLKTDVLKEIISKIPGSHLETLKKVSNKGPIELDEICEMGCRNLGIYFVDITRQGKRENHFVKIVYTKEELGMGSYESSKSSFNLLTNLQREGGPQYFVIPHTVICDPRISALVMEKVQGPPILEGILRREVCFFAAQNEMRALSQYMHAHNLLNLDFNYGAPMYDIVRKQLRMVDCGDYVVKPIPLQKYFELISEETMELARRNYNQQGLYFDRISELKKRFDEISSKEGSSTFRSPPPAPMPSIPDKAKEPLLRVTVNPHVPPAGVSQMVHDFNRGTVPMEQMGMDFLLNNNGRVARMGYLDAKEAEWAAAIREAVQKGAPIPPCPSLAEGFYIRSIVVDGTRYTNSSSSTNGSSSGGCSMM
jgi:hypothetical protein